uniref:Uncharacterized protein LOC102801244 n=1 Tax=Saccoglossus kowalevskii TaxID=10224 RepID=A0ABM0M987_SACKO|nr:PREDICTED: uncharacterized protein LOC102801244 [Saccoglossus kowalevskii]
MHLLTSNMEAIFNIPILSCASASPFVPRSNRRKTRNGEDSSDTAASSPISALRVVNKDNSACTNVCASKGPSRIFTHKKNASHTPKRFGIPNKENNEVDSSCSRQFTWIQSRMPMWPNT